MSAELISILALVVIFVLAARLSANMGALVFAGAFLVEASRSPCRSCRRARSGRWA